MARLASCLILMCVLGSMTLAGTDDSEPGAFAVGYRNIQIERPDGSSFWAWVFYPADESEQDTAIVDGDERFPVVSFGHGFLQSVQRYRYTLREIASHGYIVIATSSHHGFTPDHREYSDDLARCLTRIVSSAQEERSWLFDRVDPQSLALCGHSMGGGAAELAARGLKVRALITLAGAPLRVQPGSDDELPTHELHIAGDADRIVPPNASRRLLGAKGLFATIRGGSHCGFMDETVIGCDEGEIEHDEQLRITRVLMRSFLDLHLKGQEELYDEFWVEHPLELEGLVGFSRSELSEQED